jgi:hypothetical protein
MSHRLRRRYGRAKAKDVLSTMRFQRSGDSWIVHIARRQFPGAKSHWPSEMVLGSISKDRGVDVWPAPYGTEERGGKKSAHWEETARRLMSSDAIRTKLFGAMKAYRKEEKSTGTFIAKLSDGRSSGFHESRRARDWLEERLKSMPAGSLGGMFHDKGRYATEPFSLLEKNEHGHVVMANLSKWGSA